MVRGAFPRSTTGAFEWLAPVSDAEASSQYTGGTRPTASTHSIDPRPRLEMFPSEATLTGNQDFAASSPIESTHRIDPTMFPSEAAADSVGRLPTG